jgi:transcriptional regulator GlxA family with amidase domain
MRSSPILGEPSYAADAVTAGTRLSVPARVDGRFGRLIVSVESFEEMPQPGNGRRIRMLEPVELARACEAIAERLPDGVRRADIAALLGMSVSDFSRMFHASSGMTFAAYLLRVRLDAAKALMRSTRRSLCEVAVASGFGDQANFSRRFARAVGMTPSMWRALDRRSREGATVDD